MKKIITEKTTEIEPIHASYEGVSRRLQKAILADMRKLFNDMDELYAQDPDGFDNLDLDNLYDELAELLPYVAGEVEGRVE